MNAHWAVIIFPPFAHIVLQEEYLRQRNNYVTCSRYPARQIPKAMLTCPSTDELHGLLSETLDEQDRALVSRHVNQCGACQQLLDGLTGCDVLAIEIGSDDTATRGDPSIGRLIRRLQSEPPTPFPPAPAPSYSSTGTDPTAPLSTDDFQLQDRIGRGGMGSVYRAIQVSLNKPVAVKLLDDVGSGNAQLVARFLKEALAAASLRHPNIVDVHGIGRTPSGGYFLVMDLVEGLDLERLVAAGRADELSPVETMITIADAIGHAHDRGIVHRDLKPSNILISDSGEVLVSDFGVAKFLTSGSGTWSQHGQPIGTPSYMAPEQADPRRGPVTPATDVHGLGGILYFLLTQQHPYRRGEGGDVALIAQVLADEPPIAPSCIDPDVPTWLEQVCLKCLEKSPSDRFQSAQEVADALLEHRGCESASAGRRRASGSARNSRTGGREAHDHDTVLAGQPARGVEPPMGAVSLDSRFYLIREADGVYKNALARCDSIVLVRGARQSGKTSLMARGLQQARENGTNVVLTDFQKLNAGDLVSAESFFLAVGDWLAEKLELDVSPHDSWNSRRGASVNFERFLRREILASLSAPLVWGLDEVDRLFTCEFSSEVFGLFRSWHNERALDPSGPWSQLTLAIAYATEAHLFITDINQSPFNVGTRISLEDFSIEQVEELNHRYGNPLRDEEGIQRFVALLGGQPYLVNRSLYELSQAGPPEDSGLGGFLERADDEEGVFGDHLRRMIVLLTQDPPLRDALRGMLQDQAPLSTEQFYRLRSAGILAGSSAADCRLRCGLYQRYLKKAMT